MRYPKAVQAIGLLGGGQLARMLALSAHRLGMTPWVLSQNPLDPAAQVTSHWIQGNPNNVSDLKKLFQKVQVATVESEFFDSKSLDQVKGIFPQPHLLGILQDRLTQKTLLKKFNVPVLNFHPVHGPLDALVAYEKLGLPLVLKKRRMGYDGYGTYIIKSKNDLKNLPEDRFGYIAEPWVVFRKELAISFVRSTRNEIINLPLVETHQKNSICHWVFGPCIHPKATVLLKTLKHFVEKIKYVGILAFELFDTSSGLIVNELAPRVHNSAHYSLDALAVDQFEYHLRAITGQRLPQPKILAGGFAMVNLLGSHCKPVQWELPTSGHFHWYGKLDNRKGRKMGHITFLDKTPTQALKSALKAAKKVKV